MAVAMIDSIESKTASTGNRYKIYALDIEGDGIRKFNCFKPFKDIAEGMKVQFTTRPSKNPKYSDLVALEPLEEGSETACADSGLSARSFSGGGGSRRDDAATQRSIIRQNVLRRGVEVATRVHKEGADLIKIADTSMEVADIFFDWVNETGSRTASASGSAG